MRVSLKVVALGLALAAAGGVLAFRSALAQDGSPSILGGWTGKVGFTDSSMDTGQRPSKGSYDATMNVNQNGNAINIALNVSAEEGDEQFFLNGTIGNGNFWASNGNTAVPFIISGHVSGSGSKMKIKAMGLFVDSPEVNELKLSFKRAALAK